MLVHAFYAEAKGVMSDSSEAQPRALASFKHTFFALASSWSSLIHSRLI